MSIWTTEEIMSREQTAAAYLVEYDDDGPPEAITDLEIAVERARRNHGRVLALNLEDGAAAIIDFTEGNDV